MINTALIAESVRDNIDEATAEHWTDDEVLRKINRAQKQIFRYLCGTPGDWFVTDALFTPTASVVTFTDDVGKPKYMEEESTGYPIDLTGNLADRRSTRTPDTSLYLGPPEAYVQGNTIVINTDGYTNQVRLWYEQRLIPMIHGTAATGTTGTNLVLQSSMDPSLKDDTYNGATIEIWDSTKETRRIRTTVSDYDAANRNIVVAAGSPVAGDTYATISQLPEEAEDVLVLKATLLCLAKPSAAIDPKYFQFFQNEYRIADKDFKEFATTRKKGQSRVQMTSVQEL